jgi:hypothetical protein
MLDFLPQGGGGFSSGIEAARHLSSCQLERGECSRAHADREASFIIHHNESH